MAKFYAIVLWVDDNICHHVWDFLSHVFNNDNGRVMFFDRFFYQFCQFACRGYDHTHNR
jgi:hypothetical protein